MGLQNGIGIKQLTGLLPEGVAAPSGWLAANGYSRQLVRKYVLSGWPVFPVTWAGCRP